MLNYLNFHNLILTLIHLYEYKCIVIKTKSFESVPKSSKNILNSSLLQYNLESVWKKCNFFNGKRILTHPLFLRKKNAFIIYLMHTRWTAARLLRRVFAH